MAYFLKKWKDKKHLLSVGFCFNVGPVWKRDAGNRGSFYCGPFTLIQFSFQERWSTNFSLFSWTHLRFCSLVCMYNGLNLLYVLFRRTEEVHAVWECVRDLAGGGGEKLHRSSEGHWIQWRLQLLLCNSIYFRRRPWAGYNKLHHWIKPTVASQSSKSQPDMFNLSCLASNEFLVVWNGSQRYSFCKERTVFEYYFVS